MLSAGLNTPLRTFNLNALFSLFYSDFKVAYVPATKGRIPRSGANGDRTHDLRLAKPALSQLSYDPKQLVRVDLIGATFDGCGGPDKTRTCDLTLIRGAL
jgi:hypothetical protein